MDSIQIFSDLYGGNVTSVKKYNGDFLFYGNALARFTSSFQPVFVFDTPNMAIIPREIYSTIKNDSLFFVVSGTNSSSLQFIKLNTGFYGTISTGVGANNFLDKSVIECNGSFIANGTTLDKLIKIDASVNTDLILNKRGFLLNTENIDEFLVLGQTSLARCNKYGTVINSIDLPSGFSLISSLDWNSKSFYYSQGFTYVFGKNNNHLSVLTYDLNLVLVNEYIDNGDPISGVEWQSFHSNNSGCFALVGKQYYGSKYNVKLLKFCTADASISEESENIFQIYPNPTSSTISIQFEHNNTVDNLRIYSISGELVKDIKIQQSNELLFTIEITNINPGIYFVKIGNHSKKLIIE
jgi:hypothetical protein